MAHRHAHHPMLYIINLWKLQFWSHFEAKHHETSIAGLAAAQAMFSSSMCGPCFLMEPKMEEMAAPGRIVKSLGLLADLWWRSRGSRMFKQIVELWDPQDLQGYWVGDPVATSLPASQTKYANDGLKVVKISLEPGHCLEKDASNMFSNNWMFRHVSTYVRENPPKKKGVSSNYVQ